MPPPQRTASDHYHFYAYDYPASAAPWTLSPAVVTRNNMQFYSMRQDLQGLADYAATRGVPGIHIFRAGATVPDDVGVDRDMTVLAFGGGLGRPAAIITGGIHAREWVAPAIAYLIAEYLIVNYTAAPVGRYQTAIRNLVDNRRLYFVPMLNPNGNWYTVYSTDANSRKWRKNRDRLPYTQWRWLAELQRGVPPAPNPPFVNVAPDGANVRYETPLYKRPLPPDAGNSPFTIVPAEEVFGVDLNRNATTMYSGYNTFYKDYEGEHPDNNTDPTSESYFGPSRASALETRNIEGTIAHIRNVVRVNVDTMVDYHSYFQQILYPTEASDRGFVNASYKSLGRILQALIATSRWWSWSYQYGLGTPVSQIGYDAVGTLADHCATQANARAFVIELDPSKDDPAGFELPENKIMGVFEKNIRAALALIAAAGQPSQATARRILYHSINSAAEQEFMDWNVFGRGNQLPL
ncbi:M14 family zinc carboxypeptidase [Sorangium sp. So ce834]|uniref:M14 family zinc carboxypeptidase n=1 Tax=Sorangium sp. So ce834 TaxID=3133321 RepID=UPI003F5D8FB0